MDGCQVGRTSWASGLSAPVCVDQKSRSSTLKSNKNNNIFVAPRLSWSLEEYVRDCNLSLSVHATDFDDNFEGERVMNFMGNSRALGHDCFPEVNGCVSNQSRDLLFSCIQEHPVSTILTDQGNILVSAQIPHNVDECPFQDRLKLTV